MAMNSTPGAGRSRASRAVACCLAIAWLALATMPWGASAGRALKHAVVTNTTTTVHAAVATDSSAPSPPPFPTSQPKPSCAFRNPSSQLWARGQYTTDNRPQTDDVVFDLMIAACNYITNYLRVHSSDPGHENDCCSAVDFYGDSHLAQTLTDGNGNSISSLSTYTPLPGYQFSQQGSTDWAIEGSQNYVCSNIAAGATTPLTCEHSWTETIGTTLTTSSSMTVGQEMSFTWSVSVDLGFASSSESFTYDFSQSWTVGEEQAYSKTVSQTYDASTQVAPGNCSELYLEVASREAYGQLVTQAQLSNLVIFFGAAPDSYEFRTPMQWLQYAQSLGFEPGPYFSTVLSSNIVTRVDDVRLRQLQGETGIQSLPPSNIACQAPPSQSRKA